MPIKPSPDEVLKIKTNLSRAIEAFVKMREQQGATISQLPQNIKTDLGTMTLKPKGGIDPA